MFENVCYKKPFLKDVIARVDFASNIEGFERTLPQKLSGVALQQFPLAEPRQTQEHAVLITSADGVQSQKRDSMQWAYHGRDRDKTLVITPEFVSVTNKNYKSFEAFKADFDPVVEALFEGQKDLVASRIGLRFVNILDMPHDGDPFSWGDYVRAEMLASINAYKATGTLTRAFQIVEFNKEGRGTKLQFGIANPDHPAPVKQRKFVIDIDAYYQSALVRAEVSSEFEIAHASIQALFESSITDATRHLMEIHNAG